MKIAAPSVPQLNNTTGADMKTPTTAANLAIKALADSITSDLLTMSNDASQAQEAAQIGDLNLVVGTLLPIQARLESLQAQLAAVMALHRTK